MLYSKSCEYAFRALTLLALKKKDVPYIMAKDLSKNEDIPHHFLSKLLQTLTKMGIVRSFKGPTGGFALAMPPKNITLYMLMERIDHANLEETCAVGLDICSDEAPCPMHTTWKPVRKTIINYLQRTNVSDLAEALRKKKKLMGLPFPPWMEKMKEKKKAKLSTGKTKRRKKRKK